MGLCAVIMAGGSGTRLWPLSRAAHPKQFLALHGDDTLLQSTVKRLETLDIQSSITLCNEEHRFFVAEQLRAINKLGRIMLEPVGRNTAPAIALAALAAVADDNDPLLLVLAADHVIEDNDAFTKSVKTAVPLAESGALVTFGITPDRAHTGYGYIKRGEELAAGHGYQVDAFVEKPNQENAELFLISGDYYWNSGMFLFRASRYLEELKAFRPDIYDACYKASAELKTDLDFIRINQEAFEACPSESVDYAVMEKTSKAAVVPMNARWSDIGSWTSLWEISAKDAYNNATKGDVILHNTHNSYVRTEDKLVATLGINDLIIVSTKDAVMILSLIHI